jgi:hypothetical protein
MRLKFLRTDKELENDFGYGGRDDQNRSSEAAGAIPIHMR